jgi:hypothetical protein
VSEPKTSHIFQCSTRSLEQPAGPRIFVFGCARSGTTLLLNLMRTFDGVSVVDREQCLRDLVADPSAGWVVAKRKIHCAEHMLADLANLRQVWIIDILRDPRDVITSRQKRDPRNSSPTFEGFYCDYPRWERDVRAAAALRGCHTRMLHVRYEHLVTACDQVQQDLGAVLGLEARVPFSNHVSVMPADISEATRGMLNGVRPVSDDRVGRWRHDPKSFDRVAEQLRLHPDMESWLQAVAYAPTKTQATSPPPAHPSSPTAESTPADPGPAPTARPAVAAAAATAESTPADLEPALTAPRPAVAVVTAPRDRRFQQ